MLKRLVLVVVVLDLIFGFEAFLPIHELLILFSLEVFVDRALFEELLHIFSFLQLLGYVNLCLLLSKIIITVVGRFRVRVRFLDI